MSGKAPSSTFLSIAVGMAFCFLLALFLDTAWVLSQKARLNSFGQRTEGRIIETGYSSEKGSKGGPYKVYVHTYEFRTLSGDVYQDRTGQKSFLFEKKSPTIVRPYELSEAPRVTVLYLPDNPSISWAIEYEESGAYNIGVAFLMLVLVLAAGTVLVFILAPTDVLARVLPWSLFEALVLPLKVPEVSSPPEQQKIASPEPPKRRRRRRRKKKR